MGGLGWGKPTTLFVSYSRKDADTVDPVLEVHPFLQKAIWKDTRNIPPGSNWKDEIAERMRDCDRVILFWSRNASESENVADELKLAKESSIPIVPVLIDDCPLPTDLEQLQAVDIRIFVRRLMPKSLSGLVSQIEFVANGHRGSAILGAGAALCLLQIVLIGRESQDGSRAVLLISIAAILWGLIELRGFRKRQRFKHYLDLVIYSAFENLNKVPAQYLKSFPARRAKLDHFPCPSCGRVMKRTQEEMTNDTYHCPWCNTKGSLDSTKQSAASS